MTLETGVVANVTTSAAVGPNAARRSRCSTCQFSRGMRSLVKTHSRWRRDAKNNEFSETNYDFVRSRPPPSGTRSGIADFTPVSRGVATRGHFQFVIVESVI